MKLIQIEKKWLMILVVALCGCQQMSERKSQYIRNHAKDYLNSSVIAELKVPADLTPPQANNDLYPLPLYLPEPGMRRPSIVPPGFGELALGE